METTIHGLTWDEVAFTADSPPASSCRETQQRKGGFTFVIAAANTYGTAYSRSITITVRGSAPAFMLGEGVQIVFFKGSDGNIHEAWFTGTGGWSGRVDEGSSWAATSAPAVVVDNGVQIVFFRRTDGNLHEAWFTGTGGRVAIS